MPTDVVLAGVKSAQLGRGIAGFSGEGGHGCCTKQACVSSEWMALSQALADKFWALQNQTPLPRSWASLSGEAGGVAIVPGPEAPRPGLCPTGPQTSPGPGNLTKGPGYFILPAGLSRARGGCSSTQGQRQDPGSRLDS